MGDRWTWLSVLWGGLLLAAGCEAQPSGPLGGLPMHHLDFSTPPPGGRGRGQRTRSGAEGARQGKPRGGRPWRHIVIHHSATDRGSAALFDKAHRRRGWDELGYHFVITNGRGGPDGRVEVGSRWTSQKWGAHTGGTPGNEYNNFGIGICVVGDFSKRRPSRAQLDALRRLVMALAARYDIPARNVIGHRDAPKAHTRCPGARLHEYIHRTLRPELARRAATGK